MPDDIYSTLKENEKKIIENFNSKNMSHIQFIEEVISEYKKKYRNADENTRILIKDDFIAFVIKFLHYFEREKDNNLLFKQMNYQNMFVDAANLLDKLVKYNNSGSFEYADETDRIINSIIGNIISSNDIKALETLVIELLKNVSSSGILTEEEVKEDIKPILDRINKKYK